MPNAARSDGLRQCPIIAAKGDCVIDLECIGCTDGCEVHQYRAGEIQRREEIEIRTQPERVDDSRGNQAADQVAGDVAVI